MNQWLQVTVLASGNAGLTTDDVFYLGNQVGEVTGGALGSRLRVTSTDTLVIRGNQLTAPGSAGIENPHDLNRDGRVTSTDTLIVRGNQVIQGLLMMTAPQPLAPPQQGDALTATNPVQQNPVEQVIASTIPVSPVETEVVETENTAPTRREYRQAVSTGYRLPTTANATDCPASGGFATSDGNPTRRNRPLSRFPT
ncbi:dockerin type I domain-containing protein [Rubripirellula tenax]|nr:dockerin type I domain-containing protein [Rubripirellula tenax]